MQNERPLLSSAKIGVLVEKPRPSIGGVFLICIVAFFVIYGAVDLTLRLFASAPLFASTPTEIRAAAPTLVTTTQTLVPIVPVHISIPAIGVEATVEHVGQNTATGAMGTPSSFSTTAWYNLGSKPGAPGNAVIAGHLNNALGLAGVFEKLNQLTLGDQIVIAGDGKEIRYVVRSMTVYDTADAPTEQIFATTGDSKLVLVTCDGAWQAGKRSYDKRLVVVAEPIAESMQ